MPSDRFLPIKSVIETLLRERFPQLLVDKGSAIHDTVIEPMAVIGQLLHDRIRAIEYAQTLSNYNLMLPEELDKLASNFLITRKVATASAGTQRVFFKTLQQVYIDLSAEFKDDSGRTYRPISSVSLTKNQLALNYDSSQGLYYVDVPIRSNTVGKDTAVGANRITSVKGVPGAVLTLNPNPLVGGRSDESNAELYARIKLSQTNRELVKPSAISAFLQDYFPSIKHVAVQGFGDYAMTRDIVYIGTDIEDIFPVSFCRKFNLPLLVDGTPAPLGSGGGGSTGFIVDNSGLDFNAVPAIEGNSIATLKVAPGVQVKFLETEDIDRESDVYTVVAVTTVTLPETLEVVPALQLDRTLKEGGLLVDRPYVLGGLLCNVPIHAGGKIDVYIDSSEVESRTITINSVPATGSSIVEIPLETASGSAIFENGKSFTKPVLAITQIEQLDPVSGAVLQILEPGTHYALVRQEQRGRFTTSTGDLLVLKGTRIANNVSVPLWTGSRLRVTYLTDPIIPAVETLLTSTEIRNLSTDIKIKFPERLLVDVDLTYYDDVDIDTVSAAVSEWIESTGFEDELTVSSLISYLASIQVTNIKMPVTLTATSLLGSGEVTVQSSNDRIGTNTLQLFTAAGTLSIIKQ